MTETKICSKCDIRKDLGNFYKNKTKPLGVCSECKLCTNQMNKDYIGRNRQKYLEYHKSYRRNHQSQHRNQSLKQTYRINAEDWEDLFEIQKGCCAICGTHQSGLRRRLDVDHNHKTGKIRALLCSRCNVLIGQAKEDINSLELMINYLKEYNERKIKEPKTTPQQNRS